ncbi:hypothetical protein AAHE18_08G109900 [Arachis hypogaea]
MRVRHYFLLIILTATFPFLGLRLLGCPWAFPVPSSRRRRRSFHFFFAFLRQEGATTSIITTLLFFFLFLLLLLLVQFHGQRRPHQYSNTFFLIHLPLLHIHIYFLTHKHSRRIRR